MKANNHTYFMSIWWL